MTIFSFRFKKMREVKKLSQNELAKILNVNQRTISAWEKGIAEPSIKKLKIIAAYFQISVNYLTGNDTATLKAIRNSIDNETIKRIESSPQYIGDPYHIHDSSLMEFEILKEKYQTTSGKEKDEIFFNLMSIIESIEYTVFWDNIEKFKNIEPETFSHFLINSIFEKPPK